MPLVLISENQNKNNKQPNGEPQRLVSVRLAEMHQVVDSCNMIFSQTQGTVLLRHTLKWITAAKQTFLESAPFRYIIHLMLAVPFTQPLAIQRG